jgi:hypothetical protein
MGKFPVRVTVIFPLRQAEFVSLRHRVRNFGESLWRLLMDEPRIEISSQQMDEAVDQLRFSATSEIIASRAVKRTEQLLVEHNLLATITVSHEGRG